MPLVTFKCISKVHEKTSPASRLKLPCPRRSVVVSNTTSFSSFVIHRHKVSFEHGSRAVTSASIQMVSPDAKRAGSAEVLPLGAWVMLTGLEALSWLSDFRERCR